jgi:hypothetical protein
MSAAPATRLAEAQRRINAFHAEGRPATTGDPPVKPTPDAIRTLQFSPAGWPVTRDALVTQLRERLRGTQQPAQQDTSYCGPAAFLYCLLKDLPDIYVDYAVHLWSYGEYDFGAVDVRSNATTRASLGEINRTRHANPRHQYISSLDWMTMASLSASTRPFFSGSRGARPDDEGWSITYPWVLKSWFASLGSRAVYDCMGLGLTKVGLRPFAELMRHWNRCWLVLQIDSSLIKGGEPNTIRKRHWVVVDPRQQPRVKRADGQVVPLGSIGDQFGRVDDPRVPAHVLDERMNDWAMDLRLVTWGKEGEPLTLSTLGAVPDRFYGGFAFPHFR